MCTGACSPDSGLDLGQELRVGGRQLVAATCGWHIGHRTYVPIVFGRKGDPVWSRLSCGCSTDTCSSVRRKAQVLLVAAVLIGVFAFLVGDWLVVLAMVLTGGAQVLTLRRNR